MRSYAHSPYFVERDVVYAVSFNRSGRSPAKELVTGDWYARPSVQLEVSPYAEVTVLSTHEQVLAGETGGMSVAEFPADPAYAADLARYGRAIGEKLACSSTTGRGQE